MGRFYNWKCAIIASAGSCLYGYDSAIIASTLAQPGFNEYFTPTAKVAGAIGSSYYGGVIVGLLVVRFLADTYSRKYTLLFGGTLGLIGAIFQVAAREIGLFFAGRVLAGVSSGIMLTTVSIYQSEIAPPAVRGRMVAFQNMALCVAGLLASLVGFAGNFATNLSVQWRVPIAIQIVPAVAMISGVFFLPFSPRWLIMKGRNEEAKVVLQRLHDDNSDHMFWEREYLQISAQLALEMEEYRKEPWFHLLTNKSELKRTFLAICAMTSTQTSGATTVQVFQSVFYGGLGFSSRKTLAMAIVFQICLLAGGILNISTIDWFGRKLLFLTGLGVMTVLLAMFAAFSDRFAATGANGVAMVMIFIFVFGTTYLSTPYAYAAEVLPTKIRSLGLSIALFVGMGITVCFTQTAPIALSKIGWKFDLVFISCNVFFFLIFLVMCPETKGLSLEEINKKFGEVVVVELNEESQDDKGALSTEEKRSVNYESLAQPPILTTPRHYESVDEV
ncbi:hypothetical protein AYO22_06091 [Fonsecaea multimorphosa]|nr:hypothetical protein AYO22_06091 [Fonsecaea multimorphosa]